MENKLLTTIKRDIDRERKSSTAKGKNISDVRPPKEYEKGLWGAAATLRYEERALRDRKALIDSGLVPELHVYVASGNKKTGTEVPSVSMLPIIDCGSCDHCKFGCYDVHHDVISDDCYKYRVINSAIYATDPGRFWQEIEESTKFFKTWRLFVGGDIKDEFFIRKLIEYAKRHLDTKVLIFTKMTKLINEWVAKYGQLPQNIIIMFSAWPGFVFDNPYKFPLSTIVLPNGKSFDETGKPTTTPVDYLCDGNCTNCNNDDKGCWVARRGTRVGINFHG